MPWRISMKISNSFIYIIERPENYLDKIKRIFLRKLQKRWAKFLS